VVLVDKAIAAESGTRELNVTETNTANSSVYTEREFEKTVEINIVPLSEYASEHDTVQFVKVDAEGAEFDLIMGLGDELVKIDSMLVELHYYTDRHEKYDIGAMLERHSTYGDVYPLSGAPGHDVTEPDRPIRSAERLAQYERVIWTNDRTPPQHLGE